MGKSTRKLIERAARKNAGRELTPREKEAIADTSFAKNSRGVSLEGAAEWVGDTLSPEKASAATPPIAGAPGSVTSKSSAQSMGAYERNPTHYSAGTEMSAPLQSIADRGQARGDMAQSSLNSSALAAGQAGIEAAKYGRQGDVYGNAANAAAKATSGQIAQAGWQSANIGNAYSNALSGVAGQAPTIAQGAQQNIDASRGQMTGAANRLANLENTQGPSAAQAQLASGLGRAQANNLALARSGGGFGGSASRSAQALRQNAAMGQDAANQSAILRAGEDASWRQRQAANLGNAGGLYSGAGQLGATSGQLGLAGNAQQAQTLQAAGSMGLAGQAQNIGALQGAGQLGLSGDQARLAGNAQALQGAGQLMQSAVAGGQLFGQGAALGYQGDTQAGQAIAQDQAAKQAYENMLTQQMGIQAGVNVGNAQSANAFTGGIIGAGAGLGMMAMSDERQKKVGGEVKLSSGLYGNPYGSRGAPGTFRGEPYALSDERQKKTDFRDVDAYRYEYKDPNAPGAVSGEQIGPMAQDIEKVVPGAVVRSPYGKMVNQERLVLPLSSAVGDLQEKMDKLEARLAEAPDERTAENAHARPKGGSNGLDFEKYDAVSAPEYDATEQRRQRDRTPLAHNSLARAAAGGLVDGLVAPVRYVGEAARRYGYNGGQANAASKLDGYRTVAEVESLLRDETLPESMERQDLGRERHPYMTAAGDLIGSTAAGAVTGGATKGIPAAKNAAKATGMALAERAMDSRLAEAGRSRIVDGSSLASHASLPQVQRFLNEERAASSAYQRRGYPAAIEEFGAERAKDVAKITKDTEDALRQRGEPARVWRGSMLTEDELAQLAPGSDYSNKHIWSTGTTKERAATFADSVKWSPGANEKTSRVPVLFEVDARTGVMADSIPGSNTFEEALLPSKGKFKVTDRREEQIGGRKVNVVSLAEQDVPPAYDVTARKRSEIRERYASDPKKAKRLAKDRAEVEEIASMEDVLPVGDKLDQHQWANTKRSVARRSGEPLPPRAPGHIKDWRSSTPMERVDAIEELLTSPGALDDATERAGSIDEAIEARVIRPLRALAKVARAPGEKKRIALAIRNAENEIARRAAAEDY